MFLKKLTLKNVRCFENFELDFSDSLEPNLNNKLRKWTVLLGENGTGKSTVLKAAALITSGSSAVADLLNDPNDWIKSGCESCSIVAVIQNKEGNERNIKLEFFKKDSMSEIISKASNSLKELDDALEHTSRNYFVAGYGASRRLSNDKNFNLKTSHFRNIRALSVASLFDREASLNPLESWAMEVDYKSDGKDIKIIRKVLSNFLPDLTFDHIDKKRKQLIFKTPDGLIPLSQLSDGYQNVAAWVGDLLFRIYESFIDYKNPLKTRGLLIIDEVDLHLHPIWQRLLHDFLHKELPNMQILVTTHSAVTAQQAKQEQLYYLQRHGKKITLNRFKSNPSDLLISQLLLTDAFGLKTDESLETENKKERYKTLRDENHRSQEDENEFNSLKNDIKTSLDNRTENETGQLDTQMNRLKELQEEIQRGNKK